MRSLGSSTIDQVDAWLEHDPRWQLLLRILATPDFLRSPKLSEFLRYATRVTLSGNALLLTEQHIGEVIFGRSPAFDTSADTVVRSTALRLRRRLDQYFLAAGLNEVLTLDMPRGSYGVVFAPRVALSPGSTSASNVQTPRDFALDETALLPQGIHPATPTSSLVRKRSMVWGIVVISVILNVVAVVAFLLHQRHPASTPPPAHLLWSQMFTSNQPTRIVLGDSGLVLFHAVTHQYVSLDDYLHHRYEPHMQQLEQVDPRFALFLTTRRYTSVSDAKAEMRLTRLPQATPDRTLVQYSRDMRLDDFRNANVILLGAQEANPWDELFERSMDFVFSGPTPGHPGAFLNRRPGANELSVYRAPQRDEKALVYAVIAFLPNLDHSGNVLILEGDNMAGTEAALNFTLDESRFLPVLSRIQRPDGTLPHFEMLLQADTVTDSATPAQIIAIHLHP